MSYSWSLIQERNDFLVYENIQNPLGLHCRMYIIHTEPLQYSTIVRKFCTSPWERYSEWCPSKFAVSSLLAQKDVSFLLTLCLEINEKKRFVWGKLNQINFYSVQYKYSILFTYIRSHTSLHEISSWRERNPSTLRILIGQYRKAIWHWCERENTQGTRTLAGKKFHQFLWTKKA